MTIVGAAGLSLREEYRSGWRLSLSQWDIGSLTADEVALKPDVAHGCGFVTNKWDRDQHGFNESDFSITGGILTSQWGPFEAFYI